MTTTKQMTLEHAWRLGFIESAKWNGVCTQDADSLAAITAMKMDLGNAHLAKSAQVPDDTIDAITKAMRRAWSLGQTYWQQADSESYSQNKKADEAYAKFDQLLTDTKAMLSQRGEVES